MSTEEQRAKWRMKKRKQRENGYYQYVERPKQLQRQRAEVVRQMEELKNGR